MWRIYSPNSLGVRIRSTPSTLLGASSPAGCSSFIGSVQYFSEKRLRQFAQAAPLSGGSQDLRAVAKTLLVKRQAFRHEGEVRLLVFRHSEPGPEDVLLKYEVDPHCLIDQIMMDPRMSKTCAWALQKEILARTAFKGKIKRSLLYAPPPVLLGLESEQLGTASNKRFQPTAPGVSRRG